jgi:hypothetical protein
MAHTSRGVPPRSSDVPPEGRARLARLHARAWGIAAGALLGTTLFVATIVLVLKGGPNVGQHLKLLAIFLPGYTVTVQGAFIGFVYLFVIGYALGRLTGTLYNYSARQA